MPDIFDEVEVSTPKGDIFDEVAADPIASVGELRRREGRGEIAATSPEQASQENAQQLARSAAVAGGGGFISPPGISGEQNLDTLAGYARVGAPVAAALAFPPSAMALGPIAASSAIVGGAGAAGELAGQALEGASGSRKSLDPGRVAGAAIINATPMVPGGGLAGPFKAAAWNGLKQAAVNQSTFIVSSIVERALNEGRLPTQAEMAEAVTEINNYIPALVGGLGGGAQGFLSRPLKQLTEAQEIAEAGAASGGRLEASTGQAAPLTAAQQTGLNMAGNFPAGSAERAAQDAVARNVQGALAPRNAAPSLSAEGELNAARAAAGNRLSIGVQGTQGTAAREIENTLGTILPGTARAASTADAANTTVGAVRAENNRLGQNVDAAYNDFRNEVNRLVGASPTGSEAFRRPMTNTSTAIDDIIDSMAKEQTTTTTPSAIIGGTPTTTVTRAPAQFLNEAISRARQIQNVARSPQNLEEVIQVRQTIDKLIHDFTEIAPGVNQRQLGILRDAVKADEMALADVIGGNARPLLEKAQKVAQNRFQTLQDNPIILRILKDPSERGAFQNSEQLYQALLKQPEALDSLRKTLDPISFSQLRRGLFDSIRSPNPITIHGQNFEDAGHLAKGFRSIPAPIRSEIAGSAAEANNLQTILDDAAKVQNVGVDIPIAGGISEKTIQDIANNAGQIRSGPLRAMVMNDARIARDNARQYFNETTKRVQDRNLNPDIADDQFVRDFVLRSQNPEVVRDALGQLNAATRDQVRRQAAVVLMDHAIEESKTATRLENLINDRNRLQIAREILDPRDMDLIQNFLTWNRARNLTHQGGRLQPNELANMVWNVTKMRRIIGLS
jgi:tetratricopeptide (TPR) repeat protein